MNSLTLRKPCKAMQRAAANIMRSGLTIPSTRHKVASILVRMGCVMGSRGFEDCVCSKGLWCQESGSRVHGAIKSQLPDTH